MAAGFSLAFGAMFTMTYRVHQIFTRAHSGLVKSKVSVPTTTLYYKEINDNIVMDPSAQIESRVSESYRDLYKVKVNALYYLGM